MQDLNVHPLTKHNLSRAQDTYLTVKLPSRRTCHHNFNFASGESKYKPFSFIAFLLIADLNSDTLFLFPGITMIT